MGDLANTILSTQIKMARIDQKIVTAARAVIPALLDAGRAHSAKELQELFFERDAVEESIHEVLKDAGPLASLDAVKKLFGIDPE